MTPTKTLTKLCEKVMRVHAVQVTSPDRVTMLRNARTVRRSIPQICAAPALTVAELVTKARVAVAVPSEEIAASLARDVMALVG